jgi:hypothetical protein
MGLSIILETETGKKIDSAGDPHNFLHKLLPLPGEQPDSMMGSIDWYGNTCFNHLQMKRFLAEWDQLVGRAQSPEVKDLLSQVRELAVRCSKERTYHLKFIGD